MDIVHVYTRCTCHPRSVCMLIAGGERPPQTARPSPGRLQPTTAGSRQRAPPACPPAPSRKHIPRATWRDNASVFVFVRLCLSLFVFVRLSLPLSFPLSPSPPLSLSLSLVSCAGALVTIVRRSSSVVSSLSSSHLIRSYESRRYALPFVLCPFHSSPEFPDGVAFSAFLSRIGHPSLSYNVHEHIAGVA